jgi:DNA modification methylase
MIELTTLKLNEDNPRLIQAERLDKLKQSIEQFPKMMALRPIVVDSKNVVLGGNMRLRALQELGYKSIPGEWVKKADELTEEEKRRFIIADNTGFGEWDYEVLLSNWEGVELEEWGLELPEEWGVEEEVQEDNYVAPENIETDIKEGDLIEIGRHRLLCGDSTNENDIKILLNNEVIKWIHTDPPYGINAVSKSGVLSKSYTEDIYGDDNNEVAKESFKLISSMFGNVKSVWWGANYYSSVLPDSECWLIWDKNNGESDQADVEIAWSNYRSVPRKFTVASEKQNRVHPNQKPVSLVEFCFKWLKMDTNNVADFFGGSGVSMVWAEQRNKKSFLMEKMPKYCQVIIDRMLKSFPGLEVKINGEKYPKTPKG